MLAPGQRVEGVAWHRGPEVADANATSQVRRRRGRLMLACLGEMAPQLNVAAAFLTADVDLAGSVDLEAS